MTTTIALSSMMANEISMEPGQATQVVCKGCKSWRRVDRRRIISHDGCPGSRQMLDMDLSYEEWQEALREGTVSAAGVTAHRTHTKPRIIKSGSAASQLGTMAQRVAALAEHTASCPACTAKRPCPVADPLRSRTMLAAHTARCGTCQTGRHCKVGRVLGNAVALDNHRRCCGECRQHRNCSSGQLLGHLVSMDNHRRDCRDCSCGRPCFFGQELQLHIDIDAHRAGSCHCSSPSQHDQRLRQAHTRLAQLKETELSDLTARSAAADAPRRYRTAA